MHTRSHTSSDLEHRTNIQAMFDLVAPRYDLMNDLMSFATHRLWKRRFAQLAPPPSQGLSPDLAVDLAGGTGDIARRLHERGWRVVVCDPSAAMMQAGRSKHTTDISWVAGLGEHLPFTDNSIDMLTVSFGLRNMTRSDDALREALRVLKPGGRFLCLEFSTPAAWLRPFYNWHSKHIIPRLGAMVAGRREAYEYLVASIREFPDQVTLKAQMESAGFQTVSYENLSFGIAAIHIGNKAP